MVDDVWLGMCVLRVSAKQSRTNEGTSDSNQVSCFDNAVLYFRI